MSDHAEGGATTAAGRLDRLAASPYPLLVFASLFWAGDTVVGRGVVGAVPPVALSFWRWTVALAVILPFAWRHLWAGRAVLRQQWPLIAALAVLSVAASQTLFYSGLTATTAVNAALVIAAGPVLIPAVGWMVYRTRLSGRQAAGIAAAAAGVVVVIFRGDFGIARQLSFNPGDLLVLMAITSWAGYSVLLDRQPIGLPPAGFLAAIIAIGLVVIAPFYGWEIAGGARLALTVPSVSAILYIGVFPGVLAFLCWNRAVPRVGANTAGLFMYLTTVFSAGLAMVFLGEEVRPYHLVGVALIFGGIHLATRGVRPAGSHQSGA